MSLLAFGFTGGKPKPAPTPAPPPSSADAGENENESPNPVAKKAKTSTKKPKPAPPSSALLSSIWGHPVTAPLSNPDPVADKAIIMDIASGDKGKKGKEKKASAAKKAPAAKKGKKAGGRKAATEDESADESDEAAGQTAALEAATAKPPPRGRQARAKPRYTEEDADADDSDNACADDADNNDLDYGEDSDDHAESPSSSPAASLAASPAASPPPAPRLPSAPSPSTYSTLASLAPPHTTYADFAALLLRKSIPLAAIGPLWQTHKANHPTHHAPPPPPLTIAPLPGTPPPYQPSEYELSRLARIARNESYLQSIGLGAANNPIKQSTATKDKKKKKPAPKATNSHSSNQLPARRSSRVVGAPPSYTVETITLDTTTTTTTTYDENATISPPTNDTAILKYETPVLPSTTAVGATPDIWWCRPAHEGTNPPTLSSIATPSHWYNGACGPPEPARLVTSEKLNKLYSVDFEGGGKNCFVGGGHQGYVNVWRLDTPTIDAADYPDVGPPSLFAPAGWRWRSSNKWLSCATFLPFDTTKLLTSANDNVVKMWDLTKVVASTGSPREVFAAPNIHASGIFDMKTAGDLIGTGSKDKTVCVTKITNDGVKVIWRGDHHERVVKGVAFSRKNPNLIGSAGDDGLVAVTDFRAHATAPSVEIAGHTAPHSVVFGDGDAPEHCLMTAGRCGDAIKLWDVRKFDEPTHILRGHTAANLNKRDIHHPVFYSPYGAGKKTFVMSGGDGVGGLSIFDPFGGKGGEVTAFSRGKLGEGDDSQALTVQKDEDGYGFRVACSVGDEVFLMAPQ